MIRINRGGLTASERASVRKPLAKNDDDGLDLHSLGGNIDHALKKYMSVFAEAVESIDQEQADK
ncbi:MAG: hypothetical protein ACM31L_16405 [Actinomycetota bacterium]